MIDIKNRSVTNSRSESSHMASGSSANGNSRRQKDRALTDLRLLVSHLLTDRFGLLLFLLFDGLWFLLVFGFVLSFVFCLALASSSEGGGVFEGSDELWVVESSLTSLDWGFKRRDLKFWVSSSMAASFWRDRDQKQGRTTNYIAQSPNHS